jgi:hypothetical protein
MPNAEVQMPNENQPAPIPHLSFGIWQSAFGIRPRPAFTLVELMLSLAMVLLLILGINYVFRSATDAVSAGQALNGINNDAQATGPMLFDDLRNVSKNPPCFIIASQLVTQFLNDDDSKTSSDPTVIVTDNAGGIAKIGTAAGDVVSPATLGPRNHRADLLKFFAHANYHRRSGNDGQFTGSESSDDAFIELGHAALPANDLSAFYGPSSLPNTPSGLFNGTTVTGVPRVGAYASDWVLARKVTLLLDGSKIAPNLISPNDIYYPTATVAPNDITGTTAYGANMTPLSYGTLDNNSTVTAQTQFQSSRYDLAGVTPDQYERIIANAILTWQTAGYVSAPVASPASLWWNPLVYSTALKQTNATSPQSAALSAPYQTPPYVVAYNNAVPGYTGFTLPPNPANPSTDPGLWLNRPQCNPLIQSPLSSAALAEMAPFFLQHCSQFIVEYAGDYMQQDVNGNMTGLGPDGQIDYYLDANNNKHIRWYGMPRSSTGTLHAGDSIGKPVLIRGYNPAASAAGAADDPTGGGRLNYFTDVIPLRDYYTMYLNVAVAAPVLYAPPWEVDVNFDPPGASEDYANNPAAYGTGNNIAFGDFNNPPRYVAAWHDDMPAMIRILIKVDDPNNKVKDGPWYEYVFRLK